MKKFITLLAILFSGTVYSQKTLDSIRVSMDGELVIIQYDLNGVVPDQLFEIAIYSPKSNGETPLRHVKGDVGKNIKPGKDKKIIWDAKIELKGYQGDIDINVESKVLLTPLGNLLIVKGPNVKRGRNYILTWQGGDLDKPIKIDLIRDTRIILTKNLEVNKNNCQFDFPKNIKPGSNYSLKISMKEQPENFYQNRSFSVKRAIPMGVKIVSIGVVGGTIAYFILKPGNGGGKKVTPPSDLLPEAPNRPQN